MLRDFLDHSTLLPVFTTRATDLFSLLLQRTEILCPLANIPQPACLHEAPVAAPSSPHSFGTPRTSDTFLCLACFTSRGHSRVLHGVLGGSTASFLMPESASITHMYTQGCTQHVFLILPLTAKYLNCFHALSVLENGAINTGVQHLCDVVTSSGCTAVTRLLDHG